jgi:uncharacterized protein YbjT (DUF2867 family)
MILVTGGTGNVGRELVQELLAADQPVRLLVRDRQKVAHLGDRVECVTGDLDHPETLSVAMQGTERLFLVTAVTEHVANLIEAAKRAGVRHIVKISTIEANRSIGPGRWHREQEQMIERSGISWTFIRPTMMMANTIQWWSHTIRTQGRVYFPGGTGHVPPVAPRDVAAVACAILSKAGHEGRTYEVTGPQLLTVAEMVAKLSETLAKPVRYIRVPAFLAAIWMRRHGMSRQLVKGLVETLTAWRRDEYAYVTTTVNEVAGRAPQSFDSWCQEHRASFE